MQVFDGDNWSIAVILGFFLLRRNPIGCNHNLFREVFDQALTGKR
jgi:hypothetical protein